MIHRIITKFSFLAVIERRFIYVHETKSSFVHLIDDDIILYAVCSFSSASLLMSFQQFVLYSEGERKMSTAFLFSFASASIASY